MFVVEGPHQGVVGVHVGEEVDTVDGGELLHLVVGGGEEQAGLETVQLVLGVEVLREGWAGSEEEAEHQVEPHTAGQDSEGEGVPHGLESEVLSHCSQSVEQEVVHSLLRQPLLCQPGSQHVRHQISDMRTSQSV